MILFVNFKLNINVLIDKTTIPINIISAMN